MSKLKTTGKNHYELLYIISNKFTEDEIEPIMAKVEKLITDHGGVMTFSQCWGKKHLCYPIKGFNHGYYVCLEFDLDGNNLKEVEHFLRMSNEFLRHQVVKKHVKTEAEIKHDKIVEEKIAAKAVKAVKEEAEKTKEKTSKASTADKKKVDLKDLDEKLDKILESDNLF